MRPNLPPRRHGGADAGARCGHLASLVGVRLGLGPERACARARAVIVLAADSPSSMTPTKEDCDASYPGSTSGVLRGRGARHRDRRAGAEAVWRPHLRAP